MVVEVTATAEVTATVASPRVAARHRWVVDLDTVTLTVHPEVMVIRMVEQDTVIHMDLEANVSRTVHHR